MALIATGSIVADISGKVGDNIYSRNRAGPYVKKYAQPVQPDSTYQITARNAIASANVAWSALSDLEYKAYVAFTTLYQKSTFNGSSRNPDPKAFFIGNHVNKTFAGDPGTPKPVFPSSLGFEKMSVTIPDATSIFFKLFGGVSNSDFAAIFYSTTPKALGVRSINTVQQVYFHAIDYLPGVFYPLWVIWNSRFPGGMTPATERVFGSVRVIHKASGVLVGRAWESSIVSGTAPDGIGTMIIESTFIVG